MKNLFFLTFVCCIAHSTLNAQSTPTILADINTGNGDSNPKALTVVNTDLYFGATGSNSLWKYNSVASLANAIGIQDYTTLGYLNGKIYFTSSYSGPVGGTGGTLYAYTPG